MNVKNIPAVVQGKTVVRATALATALTQAAYKIGAPSGTIAHNIAWRAENTKSGLVKEGRKH